MTKWSRPRWLSRRLLAALAASTIATGALAVLGVISPTVAAGGVAVMLASNRIAARSRTGRWDGRHDDPESDADRGGSTHE